MAEQMYTYTNESFGGCDMVATILLPKPGTNKKQVYTLGELQTVSYSIHMDRQPVRAIGTINVKDYVMGPRTIAGSLVFAVFNKHFANKIMKDIGDSTNSGYAFLIDEIPPFDIVISAANEYGLRSRMVIYGVRLVNEGQVMSINDVYTENTYQFVATDLEYLTDENQYTSGHQSGKGLYKIVENNISSYNNKLQYSYKKAKSTPHFDIELNYKVTGVATEIKKGMVELWTTPTMKTGAIIIEGTNENKVISAQDGLNGNNRAVVPLSAGEYSAIWKDDSRKSNEIVFRILEDKIVENTILPAPIIESISDNTIEIYSNVREHTKVIYENENKDTFTVKLSGRKAKLSNLEANNKYKIATCNEALNIISDYVTVKTLSFGQDLYKDFLDYLNYNKKSLMNSNFNVYVTVVTDGKQYAFSGKKYSTIADSFIDVNKFYTDKLNSLSQTDFPGLIEYQEEVNRLTALIDAAVEVTHIATIINNDTIYGYNYDVMVVNPPIPESEDSCTNSFLIDYNINSLDFFRQYTNIQQFTKTIEKKNFKDIDTGYLCLFNGRPGGRYYTYAVNKYGFRSPKVDFYAMNDDQRIKSIENKENEDESIRYKLTKANDLYSYKLDSSLTEAETKRVLTEIIKSTTSKTIATPMLLEVNKTSITIAINESEDLLEQNDYRVVISSIETALANTTRYKIPAKNIVEFNAYNHGLKPNNTYVIWIENSEEEQVSDSITVTIKDIDEVSEIREFDINKFFVKEIVDTLREEFNEQSLMSNTLDLILYKNENEISNNKSNILNKVLNDIIAEIPILNNVFEILYSYFKVYSELTYKIDEDFFELEPVYSSSENTITISEDVLVTKINIDSLEIVNERFELKSGESLKLDSSIPYTIMFFASKKLDKRSGFMIANNFSNINMTYKMTVKVGD